LFQPLLLSINHPYFSGFLPPVITPALSLAAMQTSSQVEEEALHDF